jgi:hypothetical protein
MQPAAHPEEILDKHSALLRWAPAAVMGAIAVAMALHGPIAQAPAYHAFADTRDWLGIARAGDVLSNLPFAVVGLWALWSAREASLAYRVFFLALVLTALGSSWYHLAPSDPRLVWDRLPIALACAALLAAVFDETNPTPVGDTGLFALCALAAASVAWWWVAYDLRPYLFLQVAPLLLVPLWQWRAHAPASSRIAFGLAIGLYVLAKAAEALDRDIYAVGAIVSGHTLKHLLAAAGAGVIALDVRRRLSTIK